eukprot:ctg_858.g371
MLPIGESGRESPKPGKRRLRGVCRRVAVPRDPLTSVEEPAVADSSSSGSTKRISEGTAARARRAPERLRADEWRKMRCREALVGHAPPPLHARACLADAPILVRCLSAARAPKGGAPPGNRTRPDYPHLNTRRSPTAGRYRMPLKLACIITPSRSTIFVTASNDPLLPPDTLNAGLVLAPGSFQLSTNPLFVRRTAQRSHKRSAWLRSLSPSSALLAGRRPGRWDRVRRRCRARLPTLRLSDDSPASSNDAAVNHGEGGEHQREELALQAERARLEAERAALDAERAKLEAERARIESEKFRLSRQKLHPREGEGTRSPTPTSNAPTAEAADTTSDKTPATPASSGNARSEVERARQTLREMLESGTLDEASLMLLSRMGPLVLGGGISDADLKALQEQVFGERTFRVSRFARTPVGIVFRGELRMASPADAYSELARALTTAGLDERVRLFMVEDPAATATTANDRTGDEDRLSRQRLGVAGPAAHRCGHAHGVAAGTARFRAVCGRVSDRRAGAVHHVRVRRRGVRHVAGFHEADRRRQPRHRHRDLPGILRGAVRDGGARTGPSSRRRRPQRAPRSVVRGSVFADRHLRVHHPAQVVPARPQRVVRCGGVRSAHRGGRLVGGAGGGPGAHRATGRCDAGLVSAGALVAVQLVAADRVVGQVAVAGQRPGAADHRCAPIVCGRLHRPAESGAAAAAGGPIRRRPHDAGHLVCRLSSATRRCCSSTAWC